MCCAILTFVCAFLIAVGLFIFMSVRLSKRFPKNYCVICERIHESDCP